MQIKVSDYIVNRLAQEGVHTIFGYQGGNISHLIDSIGNNADVEFVETYHEQAAAFAANSYAQINETLGVALASSGPGAINLLNGVANAFCDSIPCLFFTGDVNTTAKKENGSLRQNSFQEVNILPMAQPIAKYCVSITNAEDIVTELDKAIEIATSGRKGPVLINLPHDMQRTVIDVEEKERKAKTHEEHFEIDQGLYEKSVEALRNSERPVIIVGGGMKSSISKRYLHQLLSITPIPVVSSLLGLDVIPHTNPCFRGMIGAYGYRSANLCLKYADCILALGTRLDDRQISPSEAAKFSNKTIIHVDIDSHEIENKLSEDISIIGDVNQFLERLVKEHIDGEAWTRWVKKTSELSQRFVTYNSESMVVHPNDFLHKLSADTEGIYTFDVGNNQMYSAQSVFVGNGSRVLTSGGLGSMGYSLPAAIGACYSNKNEKVYCICGDGGLQMNLQELQTVDYHKLPINVIGLNNNALGMIYDLQTKMFKNRFYGTTVGYAAPDFSKIAQAYNFQYYKVSSVEDYSEAISLLRNDTQVFVEIEMDAWAKTNPDPGKGIFEQSPFLTESDLRSLEEEILDEEN